MACSKKKKGIENNPLTLYPLFAKCCRKKAPCGSEWSSYETYKKCGYDKARIVIIHEGLNVEWVTFSSLFFNAQYAIVD